MFKKFIPAPFCYLYSESYETLEGQLKLHNIVNNSIDCIGWLIKEVKRLNTRVENLELMVK